MIDFMWNAYQQGQIAEVKTDAMQAKQDVAQYQERVRELEFAMGRTTLACQALWEILRSRFGLTEAELLAKINEVDLRDGKQDGRMTPMLISCPACGKPLNSKNSRCIYCCAAIQRPHVFQ